MRRHGRREGLVCEMRLPASHHVPVLSRDVTALRPDTEQPPQPASSARVLIVEDEPLITMSLTRTLEEIGCNVVGPAVNVDEGLRLIDEQHHDVALTDSALSGEQRFPIADRLTERGVQFAFVTGKSEAR